VADIKSITIRDSNGSRWYLSSPSTVEHQSIVVQKDRLTISNSNGWGMENPFESLHVKNTGGYINGKRGNARFTGWRRGDFPQDVASVSQTHSRATITNLIAATNPASPSINLPVFLFELKDIPDMLRQVGRFLLRLRQSNIVGLGGKGFDGLIRPGHIAKDVAAGNLAIQFGWAPLLGDLRRIADLMKSVEKRRKDLDSLYHKGLVRRISFGTETQAPQWGASIANSDLGAFIQTETLTSKSVKAWGVSRWKPTFPSSLRPTDDDLRRRLLGLTADNILPAVWEALPWSWLVDWFVPIGNIIASKNRLVGTCTSACVMQEATTTINYRAYRFVQDPTDPLVLSEANSVSVARRRNIGSSLVGSYSFPHLGPSQLSILASLAIPRFLGAIK
jgi:hypothetical protein